MDRVDILFAANQIAKEQRKHIDNLKPNTFQNYPVGVLQRVSAEGVGGQLPGTAYTEDMACGTYSGCV